MKWFDFRKTFLILFVVVLPLLSLNLQHKSLDWYAQPFVILASYVQDFYSGMTQNMQHTISFYSSLIHTQKENIQLKKDLLKMNTLQLQLKEVQIENERLEQILNFKNTVEQPTLPARVIAHDLLFGTHSTIRVNRGQKDGVAINQAVITPLGAVGVILYVEDSFSDILVLIDSLSTIDAIVQRSRVRGVISGGQKGLCSLQYLKRTDDIQKGDLIIATGLDNIFPKGTPIGHVINVEKESYSITQYVEVKPLVDPYRLEEVLIVFNSPSTTEKSNQETKLLAGKSVYYDQ